MKKQNTTKWLLGVLLIPFMLNSCTEDFLETEIKGAATEDSYYETVQGISKLVVGTYANINVQPDGLHNLEMMYIAFGSIASDEAEAGGEEGGNDLLDFQYWDQGVPQSTEPKAVSENYWAYNYKTVARANQVLTGIATYRNNNSDIDTDSAALLSRYEGEIEFLRAFSHFKMIQTYGGIPIVDHTLGSSEYNISRNTVAEGLHFVEERLLVAVDLLPEHSQYTASDEGRVTKGAAKSLLAKAYLYESSYAENYASDSRFEGCEDKYDLAYQYATEVINSGEYELVGINGETFDTYWSQNESPIYPESTPGYRYIFTVDGEHSQENIFSTEALNDGQAYMNTRGTYLTVYTAVRNIGEDTHGWGFNCPTSFLLNSYEAGDPRKMVTIGETLDPVYIGTEWKNINCMQSPTNMIGRKYEASPAQYWSNKSSDGNGPNNFPYIRYGDVVLMAAEASFKTNKGSEALQYVNMIRKRARNGAATGVPADLTSVTMDDIMNERLLELALEGHRFFDLVRWGEQEAMVDQQLQTWLGGVQQTSSVSCDFTVGVNEFFPIPQIEIINSNFNLIQYNGYQ